MHNGNIKLKGSDERLNSSDKGHHSDDLMLLEKIRKGDSLAFELLIRRYEKPLYDFVVRSLWDTDMAEDIVQETFVKVFLKSNQFKGEAKFKTWLFQIAINQVRNLYRSKKRNPVNFIPDADIDAVPDLQTVTGEFLNVEKKQLMRQLIEQLPDKQKNVLLLRVYQELKFEEIAEVVGSPVGTVKANYHHAINSLHVRMQKRQSESHAVL